MHRPEPLLLGQRSGCASTWFCWLCTGARYRTRPVTPPTSQEVVMLQKLFDWLQRSKSRRPRRAGHRELCLEPLQDRILPAITPSFSGGLLKIVGDAAANSIVLTLVGTSGTSIRLNGAGISGSPTLANTKSIVILGNGGDDTIDISALTGYAGKTTLDGGAGNNILVGSDANDVLRGGPD